MLDSHGKKFKGEPRCIKLVGPISTESQKVSRKAAVLCAYYNYHSIAVLDEINKYVHRNRRTN